MVDRYLSGDDPIGQFVILGAGFDTRACRLPEHAQARSFEVDTPQTQAIKHQMLEKTGIDSSTVTFVSAGFE